MNKQQKLLFYGLIVLIAILAATTSYFFAKSRVSVSDSSKTSTSKPEASESSSPTATSTATPAPTTSIKPASEKPSSPSETYTIQTKDNLLSIAQKNGVTLNELSEANGITDANKILVGQVIIIPQASNIVFSINNTTATDIQKNVDSGKLQYRLSPEDTTRSDISGAFGLKNTDSYSLKSKDDTGGTAVVLATKDQKTFLIKLTQPVTKGAKGIWAIEEVSVTQ